MKNNAFLSNAGHFNVEVDLRGAGGYGGARLSALKQDITGYELADGRTLNLLAEGRLVNLASGNGHRPRSWTRAFRAGAGAGVSAHHASELGGQVYDIPEEIDREVSRLKLHGAGLRIDTLTPEQEAYLSGWQV